MKILLGFILLILFLYYIPLGLYFSALTSGVKVSFLKLIAYRFKKLPLAHLIEWNKRLISNGSNIEFKNLVKCYKTGIDLENVVSGMIKAKENKLQLTFERACEADKQNINIKRTVLNTLSHVEKEM
jgi:uncharacterized protein YqfA (UPF0365 family)